MNAKLIELCGTVSLLHNYFSSWPAGMLRWPAISGGLAALAYGLIALALLAFARQRPGALHPGLWFLFTTFLVAGGTVQLVYAGRGTTPTMAGVSLAAAVISLATVVALIRLMPKALRLPAPAELHRLRQSLEQIPRRHAAELASAQAQARGATARREQAEAEVRRLQGALQQHAAEWEALLDVLPVGVGIARDPECRQLRTNPAFAQMLGLPADDDDLLLASVGAVPANFKVLRFDQELRPADLPMLRAMRENTPVRNFEKTIERPDGTRIQVITNAVPLRDAHGVVTGCVATFEDVTPQQRAEQQRHDFTRKLQETQKLESLGVLAGGIAHDFNNLLTGVLGNASLARSELPADSPVGHCLRQIEQSALRAAELCKQMLAYSGKGRFVVQHLNFNEFIADTTPLLQVSIHQGAQLRFKLAPGLPPVSADATQLRQILMNLVLNAAEAIGDAPGSITLATGQVHADDKYLNTTQSEACLPPGDYVYLEVIDDGCGMDRNILNKIFDPFFTTKFTGRGLGLAAVLGIVRGHRGAIKVYSEPGRGTAFKVLLPAAPGELAHPARASADAPAWRGRGHVLVVDDEETVRHTAASLLRALGFTCAVAASGHEALALFNLKSARYDAVLLDLTMPGMDGEETYRELRRVHADVRVVLMSGFNMAEAVNRFTGKGLAGFVQKPFTLESMAGELRRTLERSPLTA